MTLIATNRRGDLLFAHNGKLFVSHPGALERIVRTVVAVGDAVRAGADAIAGIADMIDVAGHELHLVMERLSEKVGR